MPGKHAPGSPASFYLSLARAGAGALAAVGLVVAIVVVAVTSRGDDAPGLAGSPPPTTKGKPTASASPTPSAEPTETSSPPALVARKTLTIEIFNATDVAGLAGRTEERLNKRGYRRTSVDNAESTPKTTIFFRGALRGEAERLLADFPELRRVRQARSGTPGEAQITIILGRNYEEPG